jgi:transglycosylase-like protein with SLT domain
MHSSGIRLPGTVTTLGRFSIGLLAMAGAVAVARADLVIFSDGRVVKAANYQVSGDAVEIELPGGGSYVVDLERVERIVDDEVEPPEPQADPPDVSTHTYDLSYHPDRKPQFHTAFDQLIDAEAKLQNVDASLVSALIRAESNFQPRAVSRKGARGLMQLMPATAHRLSVTYPFDPRWNLRGGVRYLRELADRFANKPELVLAAYNAGENAVESYGGVPPYRETVAYVKRILSWWTPAILSAPTAIAPGSGAASSSAKR